MVYAVRRKMCEPPGCLKVPSLNYLGETTRRFCLMHMDDRMVNVNILKCEHLGQMNDSHHKSRYLNGIEQLTTELNEFELDTKGLKSFEQPV